MKKEEIKKLFESFKSKKILVIGDVMIDSYLWGKVERISPEAPVPIVSCSKNESRLGGAGNVALNLIALGATPLLCGIIGNDNNGDYFLKILKNNDLTDRGIYTIKNRPTTVKTRVISGNQQLIRIDEETDKPLEGNNESGFIEHLKKLLNKERIDAVIFQDYDKGALTPDIIREITALATPKNIPVLVDPKKRNFMCYENIELFKPNFKELCDGLKIDIAKDKFSEIFDATREFQRQKNIRLMLITLSEKGVFISDNKKYYHIPAHIRDIADVSGAGDTVISTACLCLAAGLENPSIAAISNLSGGLVCEKVGVVPIDKKRLEEELLLLDL